MLLEPENVARCQDDAQKHLNADVRYQISLNAVVVAAVFQSSNSGIHHDFGLMSEE